MIKEQAMHGFTFTFPLNCSKAPWTLKISKKHKFMKKKPLKKEYALKNLVWLYLSIAVNQAILSGFGMRKGNNESQGELDFDP